MHTKYSSHTWAQWNMICFISPWPLPPPISPAMLFYALSWMEREWNICICERIIFHIRAYSYLDFAEIKLRIIRVIFPFQVIFSHFFIRINRITHALLLSLPHSRHVVGVLIVPKYAWVWVLFEDRVESTNINWMKKTKWWHTS